jgi:hypothetical protein
MLLKVEKTKISPQSPKRNLGSKNSIVVGYVFQSGILYEARKYLVLGVEKAKISLQGTNMEFVAQNQYGRVIYPSIDICFKG